MLNEDSGPPDPNAQTFRAPKPDDVDVHAAGTLAQGMLYEESGSGAPSLQEHAKSVSQEAYEGSLFADMAETIVAQSAKTERLEHELTYDEKTGLLTEKAFNKVLKELVTKARKEGGTLVLHVLDGDGFRAINHEYGHGGGDLGLGIIGQAVKDTWRRGSEAGRFGGDEFQVVSYREPATNHKRTHTVEEEAEIQTTRVNEHIVKRKAGTKLAGAELSVSGGYATLQPDDTEETLFYRADLNMFERKYGPRINELLDNPEDLAEIRKAAVFLDRKKIRYDDWARTALLKADELAA